MKDLAKKKAIRKDRGAHGRREMRQLKIVRRRMDKSEIAEALEDSEEALEALEREEREEGVWFGYEFVEDYGWAPCETTEWDRWKDFLKAA